jgi:hypothetical protein
VGHRRVRVRKNESLWQQQSTLQTGWPRAEYADPRRLAKAHDTYTPFHPAICYPRFPPDQPPPDKEIAFHYIAWMRYIIKGIRNVEAFSS